ncbi:amidase signature domain-containing protein [Suillus ampliporus]|nr:amidase signature domain-containing protein [Suillus ampliporus]
MSGGITRKCNGQCTGQGLKASDGALPDLNEASIAELQDGLVKGRFSSAQLVKVTITQAIEINPALHTVIETNPKALSQAAALDDERKDKGSCGPLHGIPLLLKDNIATLHEGGSYALLGSVVPLDAFATAKLREAGAIFIDKTNLWEWTGARSHQLPRGFSGRGEQTLCPYYPNAGPYASSSGSGVAMAVGLAAESLGSETPASIVSPSSRNNIVSIKLTVGLVSRSGVVPHTSHQDTAGPICRSPGIVPDYMKALDKNNLAYACLRVPRAFIYNMKALEETFNSSLDIFRALGAEIVDPAGFPNAEELLASKAEKLVMAADFEVDIGKYISKLVEVLTGIKTHADLELPAPFYIDQSRYVNDAYFAALAQDFDLGRTRGIDATLAQFNLNAIILPTDVPEPKPTAIAGYPLISGQSSVLRC